VGCGLMAASFGGMAGAGALWQLLACVAPLALGGTVLATVNTAQLTQVRGCVGEGGVQGDKRWGEGAHTGVGSVASG
jgi:hypothetical protein